MLCRVPGGNLDGKTFIRCAEQASKLPGWSYQLERTHWTSHLNSKINKSLFTHDNNIKLFCAHKEFGKMWLNILEKVFDCTREYQVKNRVSLMIVFILRGGIRQLISSCFPLCSSQYDSGILYHSRSLPQPSMGTVHRRCQSGGSVGSVTIQWRWHCPCQGQRHSHMLYHSGFLKTAGNVWLDQLVNDKDEEYSKTMGTM